MSHWIASARHARKGRFLAAWDDRDEARRVEILERAGGVLARALDPIMRRVLELHWPVLERDDASPVCRGCDTEEDPYAEPPAWPCRTWTLIEAQLRHG